MPATAVRDVNRRARPSTSMPPLPTLTLENVPRPATLEVSMNAAIQTPATRVAAWVSFLRAHAAITRQLNTDLQNAHGLTLNDYEVLLHLARAEEHAMRRVDLAES